MRYLSIKDFEKHQHYKNRNPPWIKMHRSILSDYAFGCLQDASKAHLMLLWLLASGLDNKIPYDLPWIQKQLDANSPVDVEELILQGFIEVSQDDGKTLASCKQSARLVEESRVEGEKRIKATTTDSCESGPKVKPSPKYPHFPMADSARLHRTCVEGGYVVDAGMLRKTLAPLYTASGPMHSIDALNSALLTFLEARGSQSPDKARFWTVAGFAQDIGRWLRLGAMPRQDPETGAPTERGLLLAGAA